MESVTTGAKAYVVANAVRARGLRPGVEFQPAVNKPDQVRCWLSATSKTNTPKLVAASVKECHRTKPHVPIFVTGYDDDGNKITMERVNLP